MTTDRIEPALTAEEWHIATLWHAGKMVGGKVRGQVVLSLTDEHRRAAAALALYGQPFGFSQEDVEDEQMIAEFFAGRADEAASYGLAGDERDQRSKAERFAARAAKIAALLPPAVQPLPTLADGIAAIAVLNGQG